MDPISIALGLASVAPSIVRWIAGDKAGDVADKVVDTARRVTGLEDGKAAADAVLKDPALALQFQQQWNAFELGLYQEETKRLEAVNATMRAESNSADPYVRRWRPTWGYVSAGAWAVQCCAIAWVVVFNPQWAAEVVEAFGSLSTQWSVALTVLGVAVWARSGDKRGAAPANLAELVSKIRGR